MTAMGAALGAVCRCRHCGAEFAFVPDFTPAPDVCWKCGPRAERERTEPNDAPSGGRA